MDALPEGMTIPVNDQGQAARLTFLHVRVSSVLDFGPCTRLNGSKIPLIKTRRKDTVCRYWLDCRGGAFLKEVWRGPR